MATASPTRERVLDSMMERATIAATTAVERHSNLRGVAARKVAVAALHAGNDPLCTAHTIRLTKPNAGLGYVVLAGAVATLVLETVAHVHYLRHGSTRQRVTAGVALASHVGIFAYSRVRNARNRAAALAALEGQRG